MDDHNDDDNGSPDNHATAAVAVVTPENTPRANCHDNVNELSNRAITGCHGFG